MKNQGFTLVELLTVIVILSLLMTIAVPASIGVSNKIKEKLLKDKINLAQQASVLWAQDHKKCFTSSCTEIEESNCITEENKNICSIKMEQLANDNYFDYDEGKKITNPVNKELCINNYEIKITYNTKNKTFSAAADKNKQDSTCP